MAQPSKSMPLKVEFQSASAIILENCKHAPHRDQCEATLSAIHQFLRTISEELQD